MTSARSLPTADSVMKSLESLPIEYVEDHQLHIEAMRIAQELGLAAAYDAHYLALARREGIDFYTLDRRLVNATKGKVSFVRYVMSE
jgi:predicted nucleic acid-binding protein